MKIFRDGECSTVVWVIMAIIIIALGLYVFLSAEEIAKKNKTELPVWFVEIPALACLIVGLLGLLRAAIDKKPLFFRN